MPTPKWIPTAVCTATMAWALHLAPSVTHAAEAQEPNPTAARIDVPRRDGDAPRATEQIAAASPAGPTAASGAEERIADLETQLRILARQIELDKEQAAERARQTPQTAAGRGGFSIASADGSFRLRLRGLLHSDGRFALKDADSRVIDSFLLRRVRPIVESTIYRQFDVRVMPDFGNGTTALQDAYVDARFTPSFKVRAGKFKAPVGIERLVSAAELTFIERALPTLLAPNRDVGVMLHGDVAGGNLSYAAGLFNGVADGGSADLDLQDGKDGVARIFVQPLRARRDSLWQGLGAGVAVSHGQHRGVSAAATGLPTFRSSGGQAFFAYRGDDPVAAAVLASGAHTRISPQGHYYYGRLGLLAEYVLSSQHVRRGAFAQALRNTAWQFAGSWVLTGETPSYRGVSPRAAFDPGAGSWGAFELTVRYASLAIDADTFPVFANPATSARGAVAWAAGLNWILNQGVKVQVNYERTRFLAPGASSRPAEHDLLTRIQLAF